MTVTVLVLAGTRPGGDPFALREGVTHKSLIMIAGQTILARVITALQTVDDVRVVVSTNDSEVGRLAVSLGAEVIASAAGPSESVSVAFASLGSPMVVTTSDHALLQGAWVRHLIDHSVPGVDVAVMLARQQAVEAAVPGTRRTYLSFADGKWSGCNLFLLQTPAAAAALQMWRAVEADRKRPWKIAWRLGATTLMSYALGRLRLDDALAQLGRRVQVKAALVEAPDGMAAVDVDKPQDLVLVRRLLDDEAR